MLIHLSNICATLPGSKPPERAQRRSDPRALPAWGLVVKPLLGRDDDVRICIEWQLQPPSTKYPFTSVDWSHGSYKRKNVIIIIIIIIIISSSNSLTSKAPFNLLFTKIHLDTAFSASCKISSWLIKKHHLGSLEGLEIHLSHFL